MTSKITLENVGIILVQPQIPENIGAVARAMHNMGLSRLVLVDPKNCDRDRMSKTATGSSTKVLEDMDIYKNLEGSACPFSVPGGNHRPYRRLKTRSDATQVSGAEIDPHLSKQPCGHPIWSRGPGA